MTDLSHIPRSEPVVYCPDCGMWEPCYRGMKAATPPDVTRKRLVKRHSPTGCAGELRYRAGMGPRLQAMIDAAGSGGKAT